MPSTTVHFPDELLQDIDRTARRRNMSRNKFVIESCEAALAREAGEWPEGFFSPDLSREEEKMLREASREMETEIYERRTNRGAPAL